MGRALLIFAPALMKFLGLAGTVAMFLVGGGILTHNLPILHHLKESLPHALGFMADIVAGLVAGALAAAVLHFFPKKSGH
jgi:predicted DNA repair protein MutK